MAYSDKACFKHQAGWNRGGGGESTRNRGFVKPGALETKIRAAAPAGGGQGSFRVACTHGEHTGSAQGCRLMSPSKAFAAGGAVHNHPTIRLEGSCVERKTNYIKGRDSHSVNKVQGRHPKPHTLQYGVHNRRKHGRIEKVEILESSHEGVCPPEAYPKVRGSRPRRSRWKQQGRQVGWSIPQSSWLEEEGLTQLSQCP